MPDFAAWIMQELDRRGWSRSEAARRGEISPASLDRVINGTMKPGVKFARGLARAFGISEEEVMRRAGLLPQMGKIPPRLNDLIRQIMELPEDDQANVITIVEAALAVVAARPRGTTERPGPR